MVELATTHLEVFIAHVHQLSQEQRAVKVKRKRAVNIQLNNTQSLCFSTILTKSNLFEHQFTVKGYMHLPLSQTQNQCMFRC